MVNNALAIGFSGQFLPGNLCRNRPLPAECAASLPL